MKTNNFYKICILIISMTLFSCGKDDDFKTPTPNGPKEDTIASNITIAEVKGLLYGSNTAITSDLVLEGYVVSSDASGNFYREIYLQDHPSNPTAGIRLAVNSLNIHLNYEVGRKLYVHLNGLYISRGDDDVISIGKKIDLEAPEDGGLILIDHITKSAIIEPIEGKSMLFSEITDEHIGTYVRIPNTRIRENELGLPFVDAEENFSTQRVLESCEEEATFLLETSAFADFSQLTVPETSGAISGIVTKDFTGEHLVLVLNEASAMEYGETRCTYTILDCGESTESGEAIVFEENFEEISDETDLDDLGWTNITMDGLERRFERGVSDENAYIEIGAYKTGEEALESWLISPSIHLDENTDEELSFNVRTGYDNGEALTVLITDNYTGDPETTYWQKLDVELPTGPSEGFSERASSIFNINCLEGDVHIAFQYKGGDPDLVTMYRIDNIRITAN